MKNKTQHNPTMMIKSGFSNKIHKLMDKCNGIKPRTKEWYSCLNEQRKNPLTEKQKAEMFDEIMKIYNESSADLTSYFRNRSYKKRINKQRIERGYEPKQKTTKEEYEKMVGNLKEVS
jgi:hypothetical protein